MSLRLRLTLLYSAILATTLIAFGALLYVTLSRATLNLVAERLADEAQQLIAAREFQLNRIVLPARKFVTSETFVQTRSLDGQVTDRTDNLSDFILPLSDTALATLDRGKAATETAVVGDERLLVYTRVLKVGGQPLGMVQVARSIEAQDQALRSLRGILIAASALATLIAFGVGWVLSGTALRPINRITQTAQAIGNSRDFSRRLDYRGPVDEVGRLATTFNGMLEELQAAYRQEEQALRAQRRFVADASHELRTPLTTIRGNIGLLQRDPPISDDDRVAALADMADESERMSRLVTSLLMLARADAGRQLRSEPIAVRPLIEDLCRKVRPLDPNRVIACDEVQDVVVEGDADALKQVLLILLDNALKWTPPEGTIRVRTAAEDGRVAICVEDTGAGIDPAALPHIFERFYRGDTARTGGGAGLGLAIARTLIEAQGGTIAVTSRPGAGSTFTVSLRRLHEQVAAT